MNVKSFKYIALTVVVCVGLLALIFFATGLGIKNGNPDFPAMLSRLNAAEAEVEKRVARINELEAYNRNLSDFAVKLRSFTVAVIRADTTKKALARQVGLDKGALNLSKVLQ